MIGRPHFHQLSEDQGLWRLILVTLALLLVCLVWSDSAGAAGAGMVPELSADREEARCAPHAFVESRPHKTERAGLRPRRGHAVVGGRAGHAAGT